MNDLICQSYRIGDLNVDSTDIHGQYGPEFPEIAVQSNLTLRPYDPAPRDEDPPLSYTAMELTGELRLRPAPSSNKQELPVCRLYSDFGPVYVDRTRDETPTLKGRLSSREVDQLERHRRDGDLHLTVVHILSFRFSDPLSEHNEFGRVDGSVPIDVPRSHWTDNVYPALGGRNVFVIEIPKGKQSIESAWSKIEDAKDAYQNWNQEGASIACREAADAMDRTVREHYGSESCVYEQRWRRAYNGVEHQASFAGHFQQIKSEANCERPEELRVAQADLECLIIRTQSLLKYAEALLREKGG